MSKVNTDFFRQQHTITLFDCQIDLILNSLQLYSYTYRFVAPQKKCETREEDLKISLIRDTYEQILSSYLDSKEEQEEYINKTSIKNIS